MSTNFAGISTLDRSLNDSKIGENDSHYWLPNDILQEIEKNCVDNFSALGDGQSETCWQSESSLYVDDMMLANSDKHLLLKNTFPEPFEGILGWISPSRQNWLKATGRYDHKCLNNSGVHLQDFKSKLFMLWWDYQAKVDHYLWQNFENENTIMKSRWWAERNPSHVFKEYAIEKSSMSHELNFKTEADRKQNVKQVKRNKYVRGSFLGSKFQNNPRKQSKKLPYCRHYNEGYCKRGNNCEFQHLLSVVYPDSQKVFLGGLPLDITEKELSEKLKEKGFHVINEPSIMHKYAPQVCLKSVDEAQRLIEKGTIIIDGVAVDVRRYEAVTKKQQERLADITRRSVFLGGLEKETTPKIIRCELAMIGMKVVNHLTIKSGFCPQVTLATSEQACSLVCKVKVQIKGKWVNVRPYVPKLVGR